MLMSMVHHSLECLVFLEDQKQFMVIWFHLSKTTVFHLCPWVLVPDETAMVWRGPMVQSALTQMLNNVVWGDLDVIVIDLPPGTGDIQISLAQQVKLSGAVIVSTPQDIALLDKAMTMFEKAGVKVLGWFKTCLFGVSRLW